MDSMKSDTTKVLLYISSYNDWQAGEWKFDKLLKSNIKIKKVLDS